MPPALVRLQGFLRAWGPELVLGLMVVAYLVVFGRLTWLQQSNFGTFDYDMGVFDQEIWLAAHHLDPFITIRGLDMWANHVNPVVYLLVPFYWFGAGPHFLDLVGTLCFGVAAVPLWLLARDRLPSRWLALSIPFAWLLYPSVEWMTWWQFHPESIGVPAFLFAYWFADRGRWAWYALCVALVLACKEDAALPVMVLGIVLAARGRRWPGLITLVGALSWFFVATDLILAVATPVAGPFYLYQFSSLGKSVGQILWNVVRHPSRLFHLVVAGDRFRYYAQLLLPVGGLALLAPSVLLLVVPTVLVNVANNQGYPHSIKYQYTALVAAGIFLALIEGLKVFRRGRLPAILAALCCVSVIANAVWSPSALDRASYRSTWALHATPEIQLLARMVQMVPAGAGVSASYSVVPHLAHRDQIYTFPNPWIRSYYGVSATEPPESPARVRYLVIEGGEETEGGRALVATLTRPGGPFRVLAHSGETLVAVRVRDGR